MITIDTSALDEMMRRLDSQQVRTALRQGMDKAMRDAANQAKLQTPVDTGLLRASISSEAREEGGDVIGVVGTNKEYAKPVEYGTGVFSEAPDSKRSPFFPPPGALEGWAKRHGMSAYAVAWSIFKRGGTRPARMFRSVLESRFFQTTTVQRISDALRRAMER